MEELFWDPTKADVEVPSDAALLVIAGPTSALPESHGTALDRFLEGLRLDGTPRRELGRMIFLA